MGDLLWLRPGAPDEAEMLDIRRTLTTALPDLVLFVVASRRPVEGQPGDVVACVRYGRAWPVQGARWAVVQRVGFQWSATLDLDVDTAHLLAIGIARRSDDSRPT